MARNFLRELFRKRRRYPIKRDQFGMTKRARAFDCFNRGMNPAQVAHELGISVRTARRYKADWNKWPRNIEMEYKVLKNMMKNDPVKFQRFIDLWSEALGTAREEAVERLQKPWGLKQLLMGKWPNYVRERRMKELEADTDAALKFVRFMRVVGFTRDRVDEMIESFLRDALKRRATKERGSDHTDGLPQAPSEL